MASLTHQEVESYRREAFGRAVNTDLAEVYKLAALPERYSAKDWDELEDTPFLAAAKGFTARFKTSWRDGKGLTLLGPAGTGKTTAAAYVAWHLASAGAAVRFMTLDALIKLYQRQIQIGSREAYEDEWQRNDLLLSRITEVYHLLVIDDVGKEYQGSDTGYAQQTMDTLLRARYDAGMPTVMTSNLPLAQWAGYSESMVSFLHEATDVVQSKAAGDFRRAAR